MCNELHIYLKLQGFNTWQA